MRNKQWQKKGKRSPGSVTITNRSPSQIPRGEETDKIKQAQIEQTYEKHQDQFSLPKRGNRNAKAQKNTRLKKQHARQDTKYHVWNYRRTNCNRGIALEWPVKTQRGGMLRGLKPVLHTANLTPTTDYKLTLGPQGGPLPHQENITMKHI